MVNELVEWVASVNERARDVASLCRSDDDGNNVLVSSPCLGMDRRERVFAATSSVETFGMTNVEHIIGLLGLESM